MVPLKTKLARLKPDNLNDIYLDKLIPEVHDILRERYPGLGADDITLSFNLKHKNFKLGFSYNNEDGVHITGTIEF